ncbi:hypothetical protein C8R46DRAFT_1116908 [Mycena filopes]|nr:hypothetical protein C8R46DRAFT_1116908 [Mycena filopes]
MPNLISGSNPTQTQFGQLLPRSNRGFNELEHLVLILRVEVLERERRAASAASRAGPRRHRESGVLLDEVRVPLPPSNVHHVPKRAHIVRVGPPNDLRVHRRVGGGGVRGGVAQDRREGGHGGVLDSVLVLVAVHGVEEAPILAGLAGVCGAEHGGEGGGAAVQEVERAALEVGDLERQDVWTGCCLCARDDADEEEGEEGFGGEHAAQGIVSRLPKAGAIIYPASG